MMKVLHLVTQRGQPYASVRRCCEMCGVATGPYFPGSDPRSYTTDDQDWKDSSNNCWRMNESADLSVALAATVEQREAIGKHVFHTGSAFMSARKEDPEEEEEEEEEEDDEQE